MEIDEGMGGSSSATVKTGKYVPNKSAGDGDTDDEKILRVARDRFKYCVDYGANNRAEMQDDLNFIDGKQWNSMIMKERTEDRRPCLTINKLPVFVDQVVNDICGSNRPQIKIRPNTNSIKSGPATAEVVGGLIRHICQSTDAKSAQDSAVRYAVSCGMGFFRLRTQYCNDKSMAQEIIVERIENPLSVYFPIPLCKTMDWSDAPYCFIRSKLSKDDYKEQYGEEAMSEFESWHGQGTGDTNWADEENMVWLAEYYNVTDDPATLYQLSNGQTLLKGEDEEMSVGELMDADGNPLTVTDERASKKRTVMWYLMSENTILDRTEVPCRWIPVIPVLGKELCVDGKMKYISLTRNAKDPQRMYNYWKSMETESIALAPKSPWIVPAGSIEGFENQWKVANIKNVAFLEYNVLQNGARPERLPPPEIPAAAMRAVLEASDDIKATTGIFDSSLGMNGNETSARAIVARQRQGNISVAHFAENLGRAVRHMGRILVDMIPHLYTVPRTIRILGEDMSDDVVLVNQQHQNSYGDDVLYDLTVGDYDVDVDIGPSYETKRIETAQNLINVITAIPNIGQVCSDILVRSLDFPGATELAERLKKTIPPQYLETNKLGEGIDENQVRQIVGDLQRHMAENQMLKDQAQQMAQIIQGLQAALKDKAEDRQVRADSAVLRANSEVQKAKLGLQSAQVQAQSKLTTHAVDTAVELSRQAPGPTGEPPINKNPEYGAPVWPQ